MSSSTIFEGWLSKRVCDNLRYMPSKIAGNCWVFDNLRTLFVKEYRGSLTIFEGCQRPSTISMFFDNCRRLSKRPSRIVGTCWTVSKACTALLELSYISVKKGGSEAGGGPLTVRHLLMTYIMPNTIEGMCVVDGILPPPCKGWFRAIERVHRRWSSALLHLQCTPVRNSLRALLKNIEGLWRRVFEDCRTSTISGNHQRLPRLFEGLWQCSEVAADYKRPSPSTIFNNHRRLSKSSKVIEGLRRLANLRWLPQVFEALWECLEIVGLR